MISNRRHSKCWIWIPYNSHVWNLQLCRSHTPFWLPMGCLTMTSRCLGLSSLELEVDKHDWIDSSNKVEYTQDALHKHHRPFEDLRSWTSGASSFYPLNNHHKISHHKIDNDGECKLLDENVLRKAYKKGKHYQATTLLVLSQGEHLQNQHWHLQVFGVILQSLFKEKNLKS